MKRGHVMKRRGSHVITDSFAQTPCHDRDTKFESFTEASNCRSWSLKSAHIAFYKHLKRSTSDLFAHLIVFLRHLWSLDGLLLSLMAIVAPNYFGDDLRYDRLSWTLVSVAVVFPLVYTIGQAFRRREEALSHLATLKSLVLHIYLEHLSLVVVVAVVPFLACCIL